MKKKCTIVDLPNDIAAVVTPEQMTDEILDIISEAKAGEYHDFKNNKYVCGKVALVHKLQQTKNTALIKISDEVIAGAYDESPDEDDEAAMKKDWLENGGTEASYNSLFPPKNK